MCQLSQDAVAAEVGDPWVIAITAARAAMSAPTAQDLVTILNRPVLFKTGTLELCDCLHRNRVDPEMSLPKDKSSANSKQPQAHTRVPVVEGASTKAHWQKSVKAVAKDFTITESYLSDYSKDSETALT